MGKTHTRIDLDKKCVPGLGGGLIRGMRECTTWPHQGTCSNSNPFTHYLFHSLSSHSLSLFWPHITSLLAHKTRMIGHDGVLPPTILCKHASQVTLVSHPSCHPTHLLHQNKLSFFLFLFSISAPVPYASWHADHSPMLATHALRATAPTTTWLH